METKIPSPSFSGLCTNDAAINISFPTGDIHAPEFRFRGLAIDGDGCSYGLYLAALESLKHLIDEQIQKEIKRTEGLKDSAQHYPLPEKPATKQQYLEAPEGWQLVPVEPTTKMVMASGFLGEGRAREVWSDMLAAAPKLGIKG